MKKRARSSLPIASTAVLVAAAVSLTTSLAASVSTAAVTAPASKTRAAATATVAAAAAPATAVAAAGPAKGAAAAAPATAAAAPTTRTAPAAASATTATVSPGIARAEWLAGCWEQVTKSGTVEEQWLAPRGKNMMEIGRTMRGDELAEYELVVVREEGDRLAYEAHPSGQPSAVFLSKSIGPASIVFENLEHDFPQRVGYERTGDALTGWIEGTQDGRTRRIEFPYKRVPCPGK